jgi:hypothetical protein
MEWKNGKQKVETENGKWKMDGIWNMEYGIWNMEYGIEQKRTALHRWTNYY